jgi:hypothetical protein
MYYYSTLSSFLVTIFTKIVHFIFNILYMPKNQLFIERGKRLQLLRKEYIGITLPTKFANTIGVPHSNYSIMEGGERDISGKVLEYVSKQYSEVNLNWLLFGNGEMLLEKTNSIAPITNVCFVNIPAFAGRGTIEVVETKTFGYVKGIKGECYGLQVEGMSMQPTLCEGDFVLCNPVNTKTDLAHNKVYVVAEKGKEVRVKRLYFDLKGKPWLHSDNSLFSPEPLDSDVEKEVRFYRVIHRVSQVE